MAAKEKDYCTVTVKLEGKAFQIVKDEKDRYIKEERIGGKARIINRLLTELYDSKQVVKPIK